MPFSEGSVPPVSLLANVTDRLPPERDDGPIEYKWRLVGVSQDRLEELISQMKFRVTEGGGECLYELGVADSGELRGMTQIEEKESLQTLAQMAETLGFTLTEQYRRSIKDPRDKVDVQERFCTEIRVRCYIALLKALAPLRTALWGSTGSGKSTLLAALCFGTRDNGHGTARQAVLTHKHELVSGQTSSIRTQLIAYNSQGTLIHPQRTIEQSHQQVCRFPSNPSPLIPESLSSSPQQAFTPGGSLRNDSFFIRSQSVLTSPSSIHAYPNETFPTAFSSLNDGQISRLVTLVDLPGSPKRWRSSVSAVLARDVHLLALVVSVSEIMANTLPPSPISTEAETDLLGSLRDRFRIATHMFLPCCLVLTHCDLLSDEDDKELNRLMDMEGGLLQDLSTPLSEAWKRSQLNFMKEVKNQHIPAKWILEDLVPSFFVSSVTGRGLNHLLSFLYTAVTQDTKSKKKPTLPDPIEAVVRLKSAHRLFSGVEVLLGNVVQGPLRVPQTADKSAEESHSDSESLSFWLGPRYDGSFSLIQLISIQLNHLFTQWVPPGLDVSVRPLGSLSDMLFSNPSMSDSPDPSTEMNTASRLVDGRGFASHALRRGTLLVMMKTPSTLHNDSAPGEHLEPPKATSTLGLCLDDVSCSFVTGEPLQFFVEHVYARAFTIEQTESSTLVIQLAHPELVTVGSRGLLLKLRSPSMQNLYPVTISWTN